MIACVCYAVLCALCASHHFQLYDDAREKHGPLEKIEINSRWIVLRLLVNFYSLPVNGVSSINGGHELYALKVFTRNGHLM